MEEQEYEFFRDAVLYVFRKRKTAFLTTDSLLKEIHFQKALRPKEDKERLEALLSAMRDQDLVTLNQPKFAALTSKGKQETENLSEEQIGKIEKNLAARAE